MKFNKVSVIGMLSRRIEAIRAEHAQTLPISRKQADAVIKELVEVRHAVLKMGEAFQEKCERLFDKEFEEEFEPPEEFRIRAEQQEQAIEDERQAHEGTLGRLGSID